MNLQTDSMKMAFASGHDTAQMKGVFGAGDNDYCAEDEHHTAWKAGFKSGMEGQSLPADCAEVYRKNCMTLVPQSL